MSYYPNKLALPLEPTLRKGGGARVAGGGGASALPTIINALRAVTPIEFLPSAKNPLPPSRGKANAGWDG